jgi:hypothetical protein
MNTILTVIAIVCFYAATDVGRPKQYDIEMLSRNWWVRNGLITLGVLLMTFAN